MFGKKMVRDSRAVSPVVGVMLMLVVTIVLAAVVSSYAGGLAGTQQKAPQASFAVEIRSKETTGWTPEFVMKHLGGDPVDTDDVKLVTKWYNESTGKWEVQETTAVPWNDSGQICYYLYDKTNDTCNGGAYTNYTDVNTEYTSDGTNYTYYHVPYLVVPGDMPADGSGKETELWFGNYVIQKGDIIKAQINLNTGTGLCQNQRTPIIANATYLKPGDIVTVELIDLNTNAKIFSKDVVVQ